MYHGIHVKCKSKLPAQRAEKCHGEKLMAGAQKVLHSSQLCPCPSFALLCVCMCVHACACVNVDDIHVLCVRAVYGVCVCLRVDGVCQTSVT
jgi:hypothetical protein